jgi:hypothetical protein
MVATVLLGGRSVPRVQRLSMPPFNYSRAVLLFIAVAFRAYVALALSRLGAVASTSDLATLPAMRG